jgi:surface carbohydrate biosynthesis protein
MAKKVLILSASPQRDKYIDELLAEELTAKGCEVLVKPCLREGRDAVLSFQPNVVVTPPIRNPYSRDFVEQLKKWGIGVISRHTEASIDWQDWKRISEQERQDLLGRFPYEVDHELIWGQDEAEILNRRDTKFKATAVGAFALDIYFRKDKIDNIRNTIEFNAKRKLDNSKRTILIASPWGFADSAPDLHIDPITVAKNDLECLDKHLGMIKKVCDAFPEYNIIVTLHPGVVIEPYSKALEGFRVFLDTNSTATELLVNTDILVHSGSTMAMEMHQLDQPAFQYQDTNARCDKSWWSSESPLSKISPKADNPEQLIELIKSVEFKSNANLETLKTLEAGRYGKMDGNAVKRSADIIYNTEGCFVMKWPDAVRDYNQINIVKSLDNIGNKCYCGICKNTFYFISEDRDIKLLELAGCKKEVAVKFFADMKKGSSCPHCAARVVQK